MQIQRENQNSKKKIAIIAIIVIVALAGAALAAAYSLKLGPFAQTDNVSQKDEPASKEERQQSTDAKLKAVEEEQAQKEQEAENSSPSTPENTKTAVAVEIPSALANGSSIRVTTLIHTVTSLGTCTLTVEKGGQVGYTSSAGVQPTSSTSTCKGFDIPVDQLSAGTWTATVTFTNDTLQGTATKEVIVQ